MIDPLNQPKQELFLLSNKKISNVQPSVSVPYRLAVIGEAPGAEEDQNGIPFCGLSGHLLDSILASSGILRAGCFVGNICKYRPPNNEIKSFGLTHPKVLEGWEELQHELTQFGPNCILALGNTPLGFLTGRTGITGWRGSILTSNWGKVVPAIHPAAVLREYYQWPLLRFDAMRARTESESPVLSLPQRTLDLHLSANEICHRLDRWPTGQLLSFDIEGGLDAFPCCSVAAASNNGFIIAWSNHTESEQGRILVSLSRTLHNPSIPKVLQNSLYDRFVLRFGYNMLIRNVVEDTMVKQWEIYPELPKGLGTIASIWTREPYYKFERKTDDPNTFYEYCIKDSCVTLEACLAQDGALSDGARRHYNWNMELLSPLLYMELRGIRYDSSTVATELGAVKAALSECGNRIQLKTPSFNIGTKGNLATDIRGEKGSLSSQRLATVLYKIKGYPEQTTGRGEAKRITTDVEALLNLSKKFPHDAFLADILLHRKLESIRETLEVQTDADGRVRCGYNLVGTETGRLACYTSPTGSGANLQTITKKLRKLYVADEGYWLFQCDLSGADGWTVAAHCLHHSDPTMWEDYHYGLKPAKIIALMFEKGVEATKCTREELKDRCRSVDPDGWLYFGCKRIQHATNYGVKAQTGTKQIMIDSYKMTGVPVYMDTKTFDTLQRLYLIRYSGLYQWHAWAKRQVFDGKNITSASGHTRIFFGRRKSYDWKTRTHEADHDTWKEFLADEPQENTTFATNMALSRLWNDSENRTRQPVDLLHVGVVRPRLEEKTKLIVEPLHTVHDALIGQFPKEHTAWAVGKIRSWFQNELQICNSKVIIPFEGAYGPSWGELGTGHGGGTI